MPKITEIKANGRTLVVVPVPEDAEHIYRGNNIIGENYIEYSKKSNPNPDTYSIGIGGNFDYKILGYLTKEEISFDVEPYVEGSKINYESGLMKCRYKNYNDKKFKWITKDESFRSLLQENGITFENPYEYVTPVEHMLLRTSPDYRKKMENKYKKAQSHVVDKVVILEKL